MTATLTTLVSFDGANGQHPWAGLISDAAGDLFGTTCNGGANNYGTVFEIAKTDTGYSVPITLATFGTGYLKYTLSGLMSDAAGDLFGTTWSENYGGTVFEIPKTASGYGALNIIASFNLINGAYPYGDLISDAAGDLFGTTLLGGANDILSGGTVFEIPKTSSGFGALITLAIFDGANGYYPRCGLISDAAGNLFGTTEYGGANNLGVVFEIAKTDTGYSAPITLATFDGGNGSNPYGNLISDAAGDFFGATSQGGSNNDGTVFEIPKTASGYGPLYTIVSFNGANGSVPYASLISDAAGDLFGATSQGGANNKGAVFEMLKTASGYSTPITLVSFDGSNGEKPTARLYFDAAGNLFGTTENGGANGDGTVFEITNAESAGYSDLIPENMSLGSTSVTAGGSLPVSWIILNQGPGQASASTTELRITTSATSWGDPSNDVLALSTPALAAGASDAESATIKAPTTPGTYYVWVVADNLGTANQGSNQANDAKLAGAFTVADVSAAADAEISFISGVTQNETVAADSYANYRLGQNPFSLLTSGFEKWGSSIIGSSGGVITYSFGSGWSSVEKTALESGLYLWSAVANVTFDLASVGTTQNFTFEKGTDKKAWTKQWNPDGTTSAVGSIEGGTPGSRADISIDTTVPEFYFDAPLSQLFYGTNGGYGLDTIIHEEGHLLGLGHGGPYNGGLPVDYVPLQNGAYDSRQWALMSYINPWVAAPYSAQYQDVTGVSNTSWTASIPGFDYGLLYPTTPMILDIMAIQRIYGIQTNGPLSSGDQIFGFNCNISSDSKIRSYFDFTVNAHPVITIWDGGPNNTLDVSGFSDSSINLTPGTFSSRDGMTNNIGIAEGTQINTVILGNGINKVILSSANVNDTIKGGAGINTVDYSRTTQGVTINLATGQAWGPESGTDQLINIQNVIAGSGNDTIIVSDKAGLPGDITAGTPSTILQFSGTGFDATRVGSPTVAKVGSTYTMLYLGEPFANNVQIGLAEFDRWHYLDEVGVQPGHFQRQYSIMGIVPGNASHADL